MGWQDELQHYVAYLAHRYEVTEDEIRAELLSVKLPAGVFSTELTPLQAACTYLAQTQSIEAIAGLLGRTRADVSKHIVEKKLPTHGPLVRVSVLTDEKLSPAEAIVVELEEQGMSVAEIAKLLNNHTQTVYTLRRRAHEKGGRSQ